MQKHRKSEKNRPNILPVSEKSLPLHSLSERGAVITDERRDHRQTANRQRNKTISIPAEKETPQASIKVDSIHKEKISEDEAGEPGRTDKHKNESQKRQYITVKSLILAQDER